MKITDVEAIPLALSKIEEEKSDGTQDALIVKVHTDEGTTGIGEVDSSPHVIKAIIEAPASHRSCQGLRQVLIGEDPFDAERIWEIMYRRTYYYGRRGAAINAMSGIDMALWDIKAKVLDKPVYKLLEGERVEQNVRPYTRSYKSMTEKEIPVYASTLFPKDPDNVKLMRKKCKHLVNLGFKAIKFGYGGFGENPSKDYALVKAARDEVGESFLLMVDVGMVWDVKTAIQRVKSLEDLAPFFIEEPITADDIEGYSRLTHTVDSRIVAGEHIFTRYEFKDLMDRGHIDAIQPDLSRMGGFTEAIKIATMARTRNIPIIPHNWSTDILTKATIQFIAATPNIPFLEFCVSNSPLRWGVTKNPLTAKDIIDGRIKVPERPGLGIELNEKTIKRYHQYYLDKF